MMLQKISTVYWWEKSKYKMVYYVSITMHV